MSDVIEIRREREPGNCVGPIRKRGQSCGDIEQLLLAEAHERTAHQRAERQGIAAIGEHPRKGDEVLHLLAAEQAFAGLRGDREPARFERALVAPELSARRGEQRDAARRERRMLAVCRRGSSRCRSAARRVRRRPRLRRRGSAPPASPAADRS